MKRWLYAVVLAAAPLATPATAQVHLDVSSATPRTDELVRIRVWGLPPGEMTTLRLHSDATSNGDWESSATFRASARGDVFPATMMPVAGSYEQVDAMGLVWSLAWRGAASPTGPDWAALQHLRLDVLAPNGKTLAWTAISPVSCAADPNVERLEVRDAGLVGALYRPRLPADAASATHGANGDGAWPGILVLGGSDGGIPERTACSFARHGYAAFALGYFGAPGLPDNLVRIPLEYFQHGLAWLKASPVVTTDRPAVYGASRGGELALLLGATYPELIGAVLADVPSAYLWSGLPADGSEVAAWTHGGRDLPFVHSRSTNCADTAHPPVGLRPCFIADVALAPEAELAAAAIPVERLAAPLLMTSGTDDQMWPSDLFTDTVVERLRRRGFAYPVVDLKYQDAGHALDVPYGPTAPGLVESRWQYGGTAAGYGRADADAWREELRFLEAWSGG